MAGGTPPCPLFGKSFFFSSVSVGTLSSSLLFTQFTQLWVSSCLWLHLTLTTCIQDIIFHRKVGYVIFMQVSLQCPSHTVLSDAYKWIRNDSASSRNLFHTVLSPQPLHSLFWEHCTKNRGCSVQEMCPSSPCVNEMERMNLPEMQVAHHQIISTLISANK